MQAVHRHECIPSNAEVFLPFAQPQAALRSVTAVRTTWLISSLTALRQHNFLDAYLCHLPKSDHTSVLCAVAGQWAPVDLAVRHYEACERLDLTDGQLEEIGMSVTRRMHGTVLATMVKLGKQSGVTPWLGFGQFQRLWMRVWDGGDVCVYKMGPKDAVVQVVGWPIAHLRYVQRTMPFVIRAAIEPFCRRAFAMTLRNLSERSTLSIQASWV